MTIEIGQSGASNQAERLKADIRRLASLPLEEARPLPGAAYTDHAFLEEELGNLFRKEWVCMGREAQIKKPGDYLTIEIDKHSVFAMRQIDGSIRAFSNVCLHRFSQLLQGEGHVPGPISCPYHAWSYSREGKLLATPHTTKLKDQACGEGTPQLREYHAEVWEGFLFVTLNPDPQPLRDSLRGLDEHLVHFEPRYLDHGTMHEEVWEVNWKALTENFIESYHLFRIHPKTLEPICPTLGCTMVDGGDAYAIHFCECYAPSDVPLPSGRPDVPEAQRAMLYDFVVFPSFVASGRFDFVWWMSLLPEGPEKVKVRWGVAVGPMVEGDDGWLARVTTFDRLVDTAIQEDKAALLGVMRGLRASPDQAGYLVELEQPLWEFQRYLDRKLNGTDTQLAVHTSVTEVVTLATAKAP